MYLYCRGLLFFWGIWLAGSTCTDGDRQPVYGSCNKYIECRAGQLVLASCGLAHHFDAYIKDCRSGSGCSESECIAEEKRAAAGNCYAYDQCASGKWARHQCPAKFAFDPHTQSCKNATCSQCSHGDTQSGPTCSTYKTCRHGLWVDDKCSLLKRYDPSKKQCVWFSQYSCPTPANTEVSLGSWSCKDGELKAIGDCTQYLNCTQGNFITNECQEGTLFDQQKKSCIPSEEAVCDSCTQDTPDMESCKDYYSCVNGETVKKSCGFLKKWDAVTRKCVYLEAHCYPGDECSTGSRPTNDCKVYEECISGNYYKETCGFSRIYDSKKGECVWAWPWHKCTTNTGNECDQGDSRLVSCINYQSCENGKWSDKTCPSGESFLKGECVKQKCDVEKTGCDSYSINGVNFKCDKGLVFDPEKSQCIKGSCDDLSDCTEGDRKSVENECKSYLECDSGEFAKKECTQCQNFNGTHCAFVWDYDCNGSSPTPTTSSTTPSPVPECSPEGSREAIPDDCGHFLQCTDGKFVRKFCFFPWRFDSSKLECIFWFPKCA